MPIAWGHTGTASGPVDPCPMPEDEPATGYEYAQYIAESLNAALSEDDEVATWADEIGSNDLADTGSGPRFKDNRVNSLAAVLFTGSQAMQNVAIDTDDTFYAVIRVWRDNVTDDSNRAYMDGTDTGQRLLHVFEDSATPPWPGQYVWRGAGAGGLDNFVFGDENTFNEWGVTTIRNSVSNTTVRHNGVQIAQNTNMAGSHLNGLLLNDSIGSWTGGQMELAELVILIAPSECAILQWEYWLTTKYDLPGVADTTAPTISSFSAVET